MLFPPTRSPEAACLNWPLYSEFDRSASRYSSNAASSSISAVDPGARNTYSSAPMMTLSPSLSSWVLPDLTTAPFTYAAPLPPLILRVTPLPSKKQWSATMDMDCGRTSFFSRPKLVGVFSRMQSMRPLLNGSSSRLMRYGVFNDPRSSTSDESVIPRACRCAFCFSYASVAAAADGSASCCISWILTVTCRCSVATCSTAAAVSLASPPPPPPSASCALSVATSSRISSSSFISLRSSSDAAAVAFFGSSLITEALFANPRVA
mmetsp:Transcript_14716/g.40217  ORF Transcript_14716/g.40217 Transcript_14716/m.40217 type:complete len:264 (-) Transcript_14716:1223-2014(-)